MRIGGIVALALAGALLAGCASAGDGGGGSSGKPRAVSARPSIGGGRPRSTIVVVPEVMPPQGLGGVIGSPAAALTRRFGEPRLDLVEGDARKLQYVGQVCVLDIFLYPLSAGAEPTATHVETRLRQGGAPADPKDCIRQVERR